jgi:hypothetical protein
LSDAYLIHNLKIVYGKDGLTWDELKQVPASQCQVSLIVEDDIIEK